MKSFSMLFVFHFQINVVGKRLSTLSAGNLHTLKDLQIRMKVEEGVPQKTIDKAGLQIGETNTTKVLPRNVGERSQMPAGSIAQRKVQGDTEEDQAGLHPWPEEVGPLVTETTFSVKTTERCLNWRGDQDPLLQMLTVTVFWTLLVKYLGISIGKSVTAQFTVVGPLAIETDRLEMLERTSVLQVIQKCMYRIGYQEIQFKPCFRTGTGKSVAKTRSLTSPAAAIPVAAAQASSSSGLNWVL